MQWLIFKLDFEHGLYTILGNILNWHIIQTCSQDFLKGGYVNVWCAYISKQAHKTKGVWGDTPPVNF